VSLRDVRILADVLRGTDDWAPDSFAEYAAERRERMRRMRITAHIATNLRATFTPEGAARRRAHTALLATDPVLGGAILSGVLGPEQALDEAFTQTTVDRIMALP
jgi:2-polyprenyl-6-methoxyphenol hydroxylase-like FAD-dependent oxidoreductase